MKKTAITSETSKYRHLTRKYCLTKDGEPGCGIDLASGGDPVVPWAWQLDLPPDQYSYYNSGQPPRSPINLFGSATDKFVEPGSLDFVYSSHFLEDIEYERWADVLRLWSEALKPGGNLIIVVPERALWLKALEAGQPPNDAHRHEPTLGDISVVAKLLGLKVITEELTKVKKGDYSILAVLQKT